MASVNMVIIVGHLGKDPEVRFLPDGGSVANVSVATSEKWKDKQGNQVDKTEWHKLVLYGRLAEVAGKYLKKGSLAYFQGRLQTRKWDKDGTTHYTTEINVARLTLLGGGERGERQPATTGAAKPATTTTRKGGGAHFDDMDDDIPF